LAVIRNVASATSDVNDPASKEPVVQSAEVDSSGTQLVPSEHYARYEINRSVVQSSSANSAGTDELSSEHNARYKPNKPVTPVVHRDLALTVLERRSCHLNTMLATNPANRLVVDTRERNIGGVVANEAWSLGCLFGDWFIM